MRKHGILFAAISYAIFANKQASLFIFLQCIAAHSAHGSGYH